MNRISSTSSGNHNLSTAYTAVTLVAPDSDPVQYLVRIVLTSLNAGHLLRATETQGTVVVPSPDQASGGTVLELEFQEELAAGDNSVAIKLLDVTGLSTAAHVAVDVWDITPLLAAEVSGGGGGGGGSLTPTQALELQAIYTATAKIGRVGVLKLSDNLVEGELKLVVGDAYLLADGRQKDIVKPAGASWPTSLSGFTITLNTLDTDGAAYVIMGSIVTATGADQTVRFEFTAADTVKIANGVLWAVIATKGTDVVTLTYGTMEMLTV